MLKLLVFFFVKKKYIFCVISQGIFFFSSFSSSILDRAVLVLGLAHKKSADFKSGVKTALIRKC